MFSIVIDFKMKDIFHPVLNNNSIFKIYQAKDESFLYSILAALYSNKLNRRSFHRPNAYKGYRNKLNLETYNLMNEDICERKKLGDHQSNSSRNGS